MRAVVQRVVRGKVSVGSRTTGEVGAGYVVLLGVSPDDGDGQARWLADKIADLRVFNDDAGKMNLSLADIGGEVLVVSQFTLYGDARRGRRPSFVRAAQGAEAERVYQAVVEALRARGIRTETGEFGAAMTVEIVGDGPVTILLDSDKTF